MLRLCISSLAVVVLLGGSLVSADDKNANDTKGKKAKATITKVDAKKGEVTVRMKDQDGKSVTKTFKLTGEVVLLDANGKNVRLTDIDIFRSGDEVLILERDGQLREIRKSKGKTPSPERR